MNPIIEIKTTKKYGRGLYATRKIKRGEVVEISPIVPVFTNELNATKLNTYVFGWTSGVSALALGLGSLFNHSKRSNVTYNPVLQEKNIIFVARKNIKKGCQLFIDYGYDPIYGIEATERNILQRLKKKHEPQQLDKSPEKFEDKKGMEK